MQTQAALKIATTNIYVCCTLYRMAKWPQQAPVAATNGPMVSKKNGVCVEQVFRGGVAGADADAKRLQPAAGNVIVKKGNKSKQTTTTIDR